MTKESLLFRDLDRYHRMFRNINLGKELHYQIGVPSYINIQVLIEKYRNCQLKLRELFEEAEVCKRCATFCCNNTIPNEIDFAIFFLSNINPEINLDGKCAFLLPKGCSLPGDLRPNICLRYLCSEEKDRLKELDKFEQFDKLQKEADSLFHEIESILRT